MSLNKIITGYYFCHICVYENKLVSIWEKGIYCSVLINCNISLIIEIILVRLPSKEGSVQCEPKMFVRILKEGNVNKLGFRCILNTCVLFSA